MGVLDVPTPKLGSASWDVTNLFFKRHLPGFGQAPTGSGYMLIGDALDVANLTAEDNTRCTSHVSDVRLDVTYTIAPVMEEFDVQPPG